MYCSYCGKIMQPWHTLNGGSVKDLCEKCWEESYDTSKSKKGVDTYCVDCGDVLEKQTIQIGRNRLVTTSAHKRICDSCKVKRASKKNDRQCPHCGMKINGPGNQKYCGKCSHNPNVLNNIINMESDKDKKIYMVRYLTASRPSLIKILYKCPCIHPKKHNHHFDYDRPFEVIRLCPQCHYSEHKRIRNI